MRYTYKFCNPHPDKKIVNDCVKRAICLAEGRDYKDAKNDLNRLKRELGLKKFNSNENWKTYLERKNYEKISFPAKAGECRMNGHKFAEIHPTGSYILRMSKHLVACVD